MKKGKEKRPPVRTGNDHRAEERQREKERQRQPEAPDGVSGNWT